MQCFDRIDDRKAFKEPKCGKEICNRCLAKVFSPVFIKSLEPNKNHLRSEKLSIKFPCGDTCQFVDVAPFFMEFCVSCGSPCSDNLDLELKDGFMLCKYCDICNHDKYLLGFICCNICGESIGNKSKAGIFGEQGLTLCRNCYQESKMQEKHIQRTQELNQSRKQYESFYKKKQESSDRFHRGLEPKKQPQVKINSFLSEEKHEQNFVQKKFQQSFSEKKTQLNFSSRNSQSRVKQSKQEQFYSQKREQDSKEQEKQQHKESQVSPLRKIIENNWLSNENKDKLKSPEQRLKTQEVPEVIEPELKAKEINGKQIFKVSKRQEGSSEYIVTNKLINEEESVDEKLKSQLGVSDSLVLKKFLSDETLVENLLLEVPAFEAQTFVKCSECYTKLPIKLAYNIDAKPQIKPKSSALLCIGALEESMLVSKVKQATYNCRVCYYKMIESQKKKSVLEESLSTNDRSFRTNVSHRLGMSDSRSNADNMRESFASQRKNVGESPNHYRLTGARYYQNPSMMQIPRYQSIRKPQGPVKPVQEKIKLTSTAKQFAPSTLLTNPSKLTGEKIKLTSKQIIPERKPADKYSILNKCLYCGKTNQKLIDGYTGVGKYCTDCYMRKDRAFLPNYGYMKNLY